jgi:hypothetical protein
MGVMTLSLVKFGGYRSMYSSRGIFSEPSIPNLSLGIRHVSQQAAISSRAGHTATDGAPRLWREPLYAVAALSRRTATRNLHICSSVIEGPTKQHLAQAMPLPKGRPIELGAESMLSTYLSRTGDRHIAVHAVSTPEQLVPEGATSDDAVLGACVVQQEAAALGLSAMVRETWRG